MSEIISIIIPTCDRPHNLRRAVRSVLMQTNVDFEIIIINDGDRKLKDLPVDARIKILEGHQTSRNFLGYGSGGYSRHYGVQRSIGDYIAFLDDDDLYMPNKLHWQLNEMKTEGVSFSCTDAYIGVLPWGPLGSKLKHSEFYKKDHDRLLSDIGFTKIPMLINQNVIERHNFIITSTVLMRRDLYDSVGGFSNIKCGGQIINNSMDFEDWEFWRRISEVSPLCRFEDLTVYYKRGSFKKLKNKFTNFFNR